MTSMKRNISISSLMAVAAIALAGTGYGAIAANDASNATPTGRISSQANKQPLTVRTGIRSELQAMRGLFQGAVRSQRYPRPGYSVKQGQRMARKASNKARNRRAHR